MDNIKLLQIENSILRKENDNLRQRITDLESLLIPEFFFPVEWELPRRQIEVLTFLYSARKKLHQKDFAMLFMKNGETMLDLDYECNIAESHVSKLRKNLKKLGVPITIISKRFEGYHLDNGSKVYMKQFIKE